MALQNLEQKHEVTKHTRDSQASFEVRDVPDGRELTLRIEGVSLPVNTLFDILGWVMSILGLALPNATSTSRNYYMPLLSLYSRWCRVISQSRANEMVHIAWYTNSPRIVFGSTIGTPRTDIIPAPDVQQRLMAKTTMITRERQRDLDESGLQAANANQYVHADGTAGVGGYGLCAETCFWIYHST